eukprot:scaffold20339_cov128-Cylindrotheca_fusiformis.AAC.12
MTVEQMLYEHDGVTFGIYVDPAMVEDFRKNETNAVAAVDVYEVFKFENGKQGEIMHPSNAELESAFGTSDVQKVVPFMLKNGKMEAHKELDFVGE